MLSPSVSDFEQNRPVAAEVEPGPGGVPEMEVCQATSMLNVLPLSRAGSLLQGISVGTNSVFSFHRDQCWAQILCSAPIKCGSWLASDGAVSVDIDAGCTARHRGQARSHSDQCWTQSLCPLPIQCGSWLASDGARSGDIDVNAGPPSQARAASVTTGRPGLRSGSRRDPVYRVSRKKRQRPNKP